MGAAAQVTGRQENCCLAPFQIYQRTDPPLALTLIAELESPFKRCLGDGDLRTRVVSCKEHLSEVRKQPNPLSKGR